MAEVRLPRVAAGSVGRIRGRGGAPVGVSAGRRAGFTLMEVMVAISIFSMALVGIFAIFSDTLIAGRSSEGLRGAVSVADAFLSKRKLNGDGLDWFFEPSVKQAVLENRFTDGSGEYAGRLLVVTNSGVRYTLRMRARVLQLKPFLFRAFVDCSWMDSARGGGKRRNYALSTVFAYEKQQKKP